MMSFKEWSILKETSDLARKVYVNGKEYLVQDTRNGIYVVSSADKSRFGTIIGGSTVGAGATLMYPELRSVLDADIQQKSDNQRQNKINHQNDIIKRW
jgi:hypothetical protein